MLLQTIFILSLYVIRIKGACSNCVVKSCKNLQYSMPTSLFNDGQCDMLNLFDQVSDTCGGFVVPHFCAYFDAASAANALGDCIINGTEQVTPWCYDYCLTTYTCIDPSFAAAFLPDCMVQSKNASAQCANVTDDILAKYSDVKAVFAPRPCPVYNLNQTLPAGENYVSFALGTLYKQLECKECSKDDLWLKAQNGLNRTKIPYVYREESMKTLFPEHCAKWLGMVQVPGYGIFLIIWWIYVIIWVSLFRMRDNRPPISARSLVLVYFQFVTQSIMFPIFEEPSIFKTNASCVASSVFGAGFGVPLLVVPLILRALRLYYLYRWNQSKVDPDKSDWYFQHKYLLKTRASVVALVALCGSSLLLSMLCYVATPSGTRQGSILSSGRCMWYEINPEIQAYAQAMNLSLAPNAYNPTGFIPYSADLSSCFFCYVPLSLKVVYTIEAQIFLYLGIYCLWLLRNLNDQYALWNELVQGICVMILGFPTAIPQLWEEYRVALQFTPEVNLIDIIVCLIFVWSFHASCVYPTILTYLPENQSKFEMTNKESSRDSSASVVSGGGVASKTGKKDFVIEYNKIKRDLNVNVHTILLDPLGVEAFRNYCIEAFVVENVQYLLAIRDFEDMDPGAEKAREALRIYKEFVKTGCRLEVNISYNMRSAYEKIFEEPIAPLPVIPQNLPRPTWRASFISLGKKLLGADERPLDHSGSAGIDGSRRSSPGGSPGSSARQSTFLGLPRLSQKPKDPLTIPRPSSFSPLVPRNTAVTSTTSSTWQTPVMVSLRDPADHPPPLEMSSPKAQNGSGPLTVTLTEPDGEDSLGELGGSGGGTVTMAVITPRGSMVARASKILSSPQLSRSPTTESEIESPPNRTSSPHDTQQDPSSDVKIKLAPNHPSSQPSSPSLESRASPLENDDVFLLASSSLPHSSQDLSQLQPQHQHRPSRAISFLPGESEPIKETEETENKDKENKDKENKDKENKEDKDKDDSRKSNDDIPLRFADVTFEDITLEVKQLVANDWVRFKKSKHWSKLEQEVASRKKLGKVFNVHGGSVGTQAESEIAIRTATSSVAEGVELTASRPYAGSILRAPSQYEPPQRLSLVPLETPEETEC